MPECFNRQTFGWGCRNQGDIADAQARVSRVAEQFSKEFTISSGESELVLNVSAAVGAASRQPGETLAEVLQRADAEMYRQKLLKPAQGRLGPPN